MTEAVIDVRTELPRSPAARWRVTFACLWLVVVACVALHQWRFWHAQQLDTDVLALLPLNERAPDVAAATRALADNASRQVIVMIGAADWDAARAAATAWRERLRASGAPIHPTVTSTEASVAAAIDFYSPWRDRLLTSTQRDFLQRTSTADLLPQAMQALVQPAGPKLVAWNADPLGLWPAWWASRAAETRARPRDGFLWTSAGGLDWVVVPCEITGSAFALSGDTVYGDALHDAREAALRAAPGARVLEAGLPLHAEAAAAQASFEMNTIGWGSLAAVLLLVWLAFRSLRPILLVGVSLAIGTATALTVTALVFGQVHLITLVFGASLVGVAEDYGIHYFASRQGEPGVPPHRLMRSLLPGLVLALATSVVAYMLLGLAPFPGLRQMALFSATGLVATFVTSVAWFPVLDRGDIRESRFARAVAGSLARIPVFAWSRGTAWLLAGVALVCVAGFARLRVVDDVRQLQSSPPALIAAQADVGRMLGMPSPAQFYLVRGRDAEEVLVREEALRTRLDALAARGAIAGYSAVSSWVPSAARQRADAALTAKAESAVLAAAGAALGEHPVRAGFAAKPLTMDAWLANPVSQGSRNLWLGTVGHGLGSVVMVRGLTGPAQLPQLADAAAGLDGVVWVDKAAEVSALLERYRGSMTILLVAGAFAVLGALLARYGRSAWRAWVPTIAAGLLTVAILGLAGQPFQLFNVLALLLLLGIGVDYGIFLAEHPADGGAAWLAVVLGAASTWLSFGLLALSGTAALRAFGLTLLIGIALVWALSPWMRRAAGATT